MSRVLLSRYLTLRIYLMDITQLIITVPKESTLCYMLHLGGNGVTRAKGPCSMSPIQGIGASDCHIMASW